MQRARGPRLPLPPAGQPGRRMTAELMRETLDGHGRRPRARRWCPSSGRPAPTTSRPCAAPSTSWPDRRRPVLTPVVLGALAAACWPARSPWLLSRWSRLRHTPVRGDAAVAEHRAGRRPGGAGRRGCRWRPTGCGSRPWRDGSTCVVAALAGGSHRRGRRPAAAERAPHRHHPAPDCGAATASGSTCSPATRTGGDLGARPRAAGGLLRAGHVRLADRRVAPDPHRALGRAELAAVLAHERSHLRARHDLVLEAFTVLHRAFPRWVSSAAAHHEVRGPGGGAGRPGRRTPRRPPGARLGAAHPGRVACAARGPRRRRHRRWPSGSRCCATPAPHRLQAAAGHALAAALLALPTLLVVLPWLAGLGRR